LKTGFSNTRLDLKKNTKDGIFRHFKKLPEKNSLAVGEIFEKIWAPQATGSE
jgi:hypothetical protein